MLWNLEEKSSCIKDQWQLPIIPWNGKPPATAAAVATTKATAGGEKIAPTDGALDAVKKVQQPQQPHGEVLAGVDAIGVWAKASYGSGEADWETWHERLCHVNFPMLQKLVKDGSGRVCRLKKAIYGLKQAPRAWYHKLEETLLAGGFKKSECDHSLFLQQEKEQFLTLRVYVDDILLFSESSTMIERMEELLEMQFKCSKMGDVKYYLGMHVERDLDKGVLRLHQRKYCEGLAEKYGLQDGGKPATPLLSGFTVEPCAHEEVCCEAKAATDVADLGKGEMLLTCYIDASFNSVKMDGTSIGSYVCLFGGGVVSWRSKKQNEVVLSLCETEYMALHDGVKEVPQTGAATSNNRSVGALAGSSLYKLATEPPEVAASAQVSASGQVAPPCSCCLLSHQTVLWHHRLGHSSLPRLRGMHSCLLVSGLPKFVPPFPPSPAQPCLPCVEGRQHAAPHSSSFPATTAPLQTLELRVLVLSLLCLEALRGRGRTTFRSFSSRPLHCLVFLLTLDRLEVLRSVVSLSLVLCCLSLVLKRLSALGRRVLRPSPPPVPGTHSVTLRPSTAPQRVPLPSPLASSFHDGPDSLPAASPTVTCFLACAVTDPLFESTTAFALVAELVDLAAACRLDYATSLVAVSVSASVCPPSVGGECALGTNVLEDRQEEFECFAAAVPHLVSMLLAPEGDPDSPDIPTPRSYVEAIELHSLDFSTAFLQGSPHEEIWLRRPPGFTGSFLASTQWSLRRPVNGLRQAPREWHDTLRTTLAALGFAPSTAVPSLFLCTDTTLSPFYVLVAQRTITLTQSHMVQQVLQRFDFTYSSPQSTPLPTGHSLSAPPSDESVEPSGLYPELVGCLMYLMTCTRPDLANPLSILARYVAPGRHRKEHMDAAKRVLRYLCSTSGMWLVLGGRAQVVLTGHADASWELRWLTYLLTDLGEAPRSPPVLETKDGRPCMRRSVCMVFGDPHYKYCRYDEGGIDIKKQTMRKHHHSIKHEAAVREKEQRDGLKKGQKSIVEFHKGVDYGNLIARLMAITLFICNFDAPIVLFVALVHFMAEQGTPDMPLKENGAYYSEYGFAQIMETMAWFLRSRQLKHIRASPYLGIQLDESTDRRRRKHTIVYMMFLHDNLPVTGFYALLIVEQSDTALLQTILLTHLETMGIDLQRISGMSTDGASVMTGQHNGLVARLRSKIPHIVSCHCVAHMRVRVSGFVSELP
ncbi:unnamed protein product [Closterium sp. NIES-54]